MRFLFLLLFATNLFAADEVFLTGTITAGNNSVAIIKYQSKTLILKTGATVGGWAIKEIQQKQIILANRKGLQTLRTGEYILRYGSPLQAVVVREEGNNIFVDMDVVGQQHIIQNSDAFAEEASSKQIVENGEIIGYKIFNFDPGSVWEQSGFKIGDIITHIDGKHIWNGRIGLGKLHDIKDLKQFDVVIRRGNKTKIMHVRVNL